MAQRSQSYDGSHGSIDPTQTETTQTADERGRRRKLLSWLFGVDAATWHLKERWPQRTCSFYVEDLRDYMKHEELKSNFPKAQPSPGRLCESLTQHDRILEVLGEEELDVPDGVFAPVHNLSKPERDGMEANNALVEVFQAWTEQCRVLLQGRGTSSQAGETTQKLQGYQALANRFLDQFPQYQWADDDNTDDVQAERDSHDPPPCSQDLCAQDGYGGGASATVETAEVERAGSQDTEKPDRNIQTETHKVVGAMDTPQTRETVSSVLGQPRYLDLERCLQDWSRSFRSHE